MLGVIMKKIILYLLIIMNMYSIDIVSANGNISFSFDTDRALVKDIQLSQNLNKYDIDFMGIALVYENQIYPLDKYPVEVEVSKENNHIIQKGIVAEKFPYKITMYASMLEKNRLVFDVEVDTKEEINIAYYLKVKNTYRNFDLIGDIYQYDFFYFKNDKKDIKAYFTNDYLMSETRLLPFTKESIVKDDLAIFFLEEGSRSRSQFVIISDSLNPRENLVDTNSEKEFWYTDNLSDEEKYINTLKAFTRRDGSLYNFSLNNGLVYVDDILSGIEAFLLYGYIDEAKRSIRYLINSGLSFDKEYLISNYAYDLERNEVLKKDNYGPMLNPISSAKFLELLQLYYEKTGDLDYIKQVYDEVDERVAKYLLSFVSEQGVVKNSGDYRIGQLGMKPFIESQKAVYDSFLAYAKLLESLEIDNSIYIEKAEVIKKTIILYYLDLGKVLDTPFSDEASINNIYYVTKDFFFDINEYYTFVQNHLKSVDRYKDKTLLEQVEFINFLLDNKYYLVGEDRKESLVGKMEKSDLHSLYQLQESIEFSAKYLIMLKKGRKDGDSL